ncbi:MAG TPA: acyl-CoA dehydrogenase, partial [Variovorax sp.]
TTQLAMAAQARPRLAYEVADDYLRLVMLAMLAWAWARIEQAPGADDDHARAAAAFRRWVLPEFEMRAGIVKRACEETIARPAEAMR